MSLIENSKNDASGFVFYQLGEIQHNSSLVPPTSTDPRLLRVKTWFSSRYVLVTSNDEKPDGTQKLGAIWMLYNYWFLVEVGDGERYHDDGSQRIPGDPDPRLYSGLKIADYYEQLGAKYVKKPTEDIIKIDFELVGCFRLPDKRIVRQFQQSIVEGKK